MLLKKVLTAVLAVSLTVSSLFAFTGCSLFMVTMPEEGQVSTSAVIKGIDKNEAADKNGEVEEIDEIKEIDEWGLKFIASDITNTGMTLTAVQSGGNYTGELNTGEYFAVEKKTDSGWQELTPAAKDVTWHQLAYMIKPSDSTSWEIDWSFLYGEIEKGSYRICKKVMDFREAGDYDEKLYYAEFEIK